MGVFNRGELPDELKDLNLTPAQIREKLQSGQKTENELTEARTNLEGMKTSGNTTKAELDAARAKISELEAAARGGDPDPNPRLEKTSFLTNEDAAFSERFNESVGPVAQIAAQANAKAAKMLARNMLSQKNISTQDRTINLGRLWDKWLPEIDEAAKNMNVVTLGSEQTWLNLFNFIKGQHVEELMGKPETFFEPSQTSTHVTVGGEDQRAEKLNDEEASIASKMARYGKGVSPEKILETRKKLKYVTV